MNLFECQLDPVESFLKRRHGKKQKITQRNQPINVRTVADVILVAHLFVEFSAGTDDTVDADLKQVTFEPKLSTVADQLMQANGIVETRKRGPVYIY